MNLRESIQRTYSYGQIFNYQRSLDEVHHWLISPKKVSKDKVRDGIEKTSLKYKQKKVNNLFSRKKIALAQKKLKLLYMFPTIQLVGLTGSVSANNARNNDDIDVFIVTSPNTLWLTRPFVIFFLEIIGARRRRGTSIKKQKDLICTNLWMDRSSLKLPKQQQNLYTAHEVLQVLPIYNKNFCYEMFIKQNNWVKKYLANAYSYSKKNLDVEDKNSYFSAIFIPVNMIFYFIQILIMLPISKGERVNYHQAFFHDSKYSEKIIKQTH